MKRGDLWVVEGSVAAAAATLHALIVATESFVFLCINYAAAIFHAADFNCHISMYPLAGTNPRLI